jgi:hypothetical protein
MPSSSAKQHRFMEAIAHNKAFAKKVGVPQSVGQEYSKADKGKTFKQGGDMMSKKMFEKSGKDVEKKGMKEGSKADMKMDKMQMMKKGGMKKMADGGITTAKMSKVKAGGNRPHGEHSIQEKGHTKAMMPTMKSSTPLGMKKGGKTK